MSDDLMTEKDQPNIEALALELAHDDMWEYVMGDRWMGWPDTDIPEQVEEYIESAMPRCRERAQRYADLLFPPGSTSTGEAHRG